MSENFMSFVERIDSIPSTPAMMARIQGVLQNPKSSVQDVCDVIVTDQAVISKILRIVNSGYYQFETAISSLKQAVAILGFDMIRNIVLGVSVINTFKDHEKRGFDRNRLWIHSIATGIAAKVISEKSGIKLEDDSEADYFMLGVLHDFGKVIMECYFPDRFREILALTSQEGMSFIKAEKRIMGVFTHTKIGSIVAMEWGFPQLFRQVVEFHHSPLLLQGDPFLITSILHVADYVAKLVETGGYQAKEVEPIEKRTLDVVGLQWSQLDLVVDVLQVEMKRTDSILNLFSDNK